MPQPESTNPKSTGSPGKPKVNWGVIDQLLDDARGTPIPLEEFIDQVVAHAQSSAKKPKVIARKRILDANGISLILQEGDLVYPIWAVMRNHRFRIPLDRDSFDDGILASLFAHYIRSSPLGLPMAWHCTDINGHLIARATEAEVNIFDKETRMNALGWLNKMQAKPGDQLLCNVEDWGTGLVANRQRMSGTEKSNVTAIGRMSSRA